VRDANNCETSETISISQPDAELSFTTTLTDVLCYGNATGAIEITATGGTANYEFSIDNGGSFQAENSFDNLLAGEYEIIVRDANNCETSETISINQPDAELSFTTTLSDVLCYGNATGAIEITATGGTANYEYSIDNGGSFQTENTFENLLAGDYQIVVRDANNCETSETISISQPDAELSFTTTLTDVLCYGNATGAIEITATGGTTDYEYSIDNGGSFQAGNSFENLLAGEYEIIVRDANNCETSETVNISQPDAELSFTTTLSDVLCYGNATGAIEITATGGTANYEYSIDNGGSFQTENSFDNLLAGEYEIIVRDANNCETSEMVNISQPDAELSFTTTLTDVLCYGNATGAIEIEAIGGTANYEYSIDNGGSFQAENSFENLMAGDYEIIVRDANNCETSETINISQPEAELSFTTMLTDVLCYGNATGAIEITATGGTTNYEYSIDNGGSFQTENSFENLMAGDYDIVVRDANNCETSETVNISQPDAELSFTTTLTDVLCYDNATGAIEITPTGGTANYEYSIDNGGSFQADNTFENLLAGDYEIIVRDANNCETSETISINQPDAELSFTTTLTVVLCHGNATGAIEITAIGGTTNYEYSIDNGGSFQTENSFENLIAGEYEIIVRDANNCETSETVNISQPDAELSFTTTITDVLCYGEATGGIEITATGGVTDYEYSIDNGITFQASNIFTGLLAGDYEVMVKDANQCESMSMVSISEPSSALSFTTTITDVLCFGEATGGIEITASGGVPTYEYSIDNGITFQASNIFTDLIAGDYEVMVKDANTCESTSIVSISQPDELAISADLVHIACFGGNDGEILISANGGAEEYLYSINNGLDYQSSAVFTNLIAGEYYIRVQDANACEASSIEVLTEPASLPNVSFSGLDSHYCSYDEPIVLIGNQAPMGSFEGEGITDNGDGTAVFSPELAGTGNHEIIYYYTSPESCYNFEMQNTNVSSPTVVSIEGLSEQYCLSTNDILITGSEAPLGEFSGVGVLDNGDGTAWFSPSTVGVGAEHIIIYQFTNADGCFSEVEVQTQVLEDPIAIQSGLLAQYCIDSDDVIITSNDPQGNFSGPGIIDHNNGTATFSPALAGVGGPFEIEYVLTNDIGCQAEDIQEVTIYDYVEISFAGLDDFYCSNANSAIITGSEAPFGYFMGSGVLDHGDGTAELNLSSLPVGGPYDLAYYYAEAGGCLSEYHQEFTVVEAESIDFSGLEMSYCFADESHQLIGSHAPECYFEGNGIEQQSDGHAWYNPSLVVAGQEDTITYFYENENLCLSNTSHITLVKENPVADFEFALYQCNDEAVFMDQSYSANGEIVSWNWNFGDIYSGAFNSSNLQNPVHEFVTNYSTFNVHLEVEDETGCYGDIIKPLIPYSGVTIKGNVSKTNGEPIENGYVAAFYLSDGVLSVFADLTPIQENGDYEFVGMSSCVEYLIHAIPNKFDYPFVFPRWYDDAFYWTDATVVSASLGNEVIEHVDFSLVDHNPIPNGPSSLSGGVYYLNSKGEPVKNVDVILEFDAADDKISDVSSFEISDEEGQWKFDNLPNGNFKVKVDMPGLRMDSVYQVSISTSETHITDLNYYVDTLSGIYIIFTGIEELNQQAFGQIDIYPNPNEGHFSLAVSKTAGQVEIEEIEIWDLEGRFIRRISANYKGLQYEAELDFTELQSGVYLLKLKNGEEIGLRKFVIQK
ncbi:T9SS type A sorting domain-containing protein, partial [Lentimicrobium sp. L6]|uniref:T9SS type A sorting domain-containing protein n=1 Tax=Lentimicrobium sp. L6 TaxID=2735916 RepID=UPI0015517F98